MISFLVILMLLYFIKEQFSYGAVNKVTYYFLPLFSLLQVAFHFHYSRNNLVVLLFCFLTGSLVGYYQAKHAKIRQHLIPVYVYFEENGKKKNIYKNQVAVRGGTHYLIGWCIIFAIQLAIQLILTANKVQLGSTLYEELLEDLFSIYRLQDFEKGAQNWFTWSLYGFSSLSYLLYLCKRNIAVKEILFHTNKEIIE